jgi:hypothetical protein
MVKILTNALWPPPEERAGALPGPGRPSPQATRTCRPRPQAALAPQAQARRLGAPPVLPAAPKASRPALRPAWEAIMPFPTPRAPSLPERGSPLTAPADGAFARGSGTGPAIRIRASTGKRPASRPAAGDPDSAIRTGGRRPAGRRPAGRRPAIRIRSGFCDPDSRVGARLGGLRRGRHGQGERPASRPAAGGRRATTSRAWQPAISSRPARTGVEIGRN